MLPITQDLLTSKRNRPFLKDSDLYALQRIKGVVAHWTANLNPGATAKANRNYFNNTERFASAHYVVDDHSIIQCIPDNEVAYHVGASSYKPDGVRIKENAESPNYFLIGFEMCVNSDGDWAITYKNAVQLAAHLLHKYQFSTADLYRHFDITGKDCPKMMLDAASWASFKKDIQKVLDGFTPPPFARGKISSSELNVRQGPGTQFRILEKLPQNRVVDILEEKDGWYRIGTGRWVSKNYIALLFRTQLAQVIEKQGTTVHKGPGPQYAVIDALPKGALQYLTGRDGQWFQIGTDRWVLTSEVELLTIQSGTVTGANDLNVRIGPGTEFPIVRRIKIGEKVQIIGEANNWFRIGANEWVYSKFIAD